MDDVWYILGTSKDINNIDGKWFNGKSIIAMNGSYEIAAKYGRQVDEWICHDQCFMFFKEIVHNSIPAFRKWVLYDYAVDERLQRFRPNRTNYERWKDHNVWFYTVRTSRTNLPELKPHIAKSPSDNLTILDNYIYTIFTATSLAVGLGAKEIRYRGVELGGSHFNDKKKCNLDHHYGEQSMKFKKFIIPACVEMGIKLINETPNARHNINTPS